MRNVFTSQSFLVVILWVTVASSDVRSQVLDDKRPKKKIESQLIFSASSYQADYGRALGAHWWYNAFASFSPDGSAILVGSFADHQVCRIDTKSLERTEVSNSLRNRFVSMHPITGEIFAWRFRGRVSDAKLKDLFANEKTKNIADSKAADVSALVEKQPFDLVNYRSIEDFKAEKPNWTIPDADHAYFNPHVRSSGGWSWRHTYATRFCWLPKYRVYATIRPMSYEKRNEEELLFFDTEGRVVGRFDFAVIMGIDIGESGIEVYQRTGKRKPYFVQLSIIDEKLTRVQETKKLYRLPPEWIDGYPFLTFGTKLLRYVDHRPGDVKKFFTELMNDGRFWSYQDYPNLREQFLGSNEQLTTEHYNSLSTSLQRYSNFGKLSSMDSTAIPEITSISKSYDGVVRQRNELVMYHTGELLPLPSNMTIVDAFCDKEQQMMLGVIPGSGTDAVFYLIKLVSEPEAEK